MDQKNQPVPQSPYGNMTTRPKKKKTGLIVGITLGVIAAIVIIAAVLVYFLWWQNPQKMVTDAVSSAITTKRATANGKVVVDMQDSAKLELNIKAASVSDKAKVNIDATLNVKAVEKKFSLKGDVAIDGDGTIYIKIDNLKDLYGDILDMIIEKQSVESGINLSKDQMKSYRDQALGRLDSQLDKVNGKWMKISPTEFTDDNNKCYADILKKVRSDENVRKEISQFYQKNSFLDVKDTKLSDRNGGRGFEVEVNRDKAAKFANQLKDSSIGKEIGNCKKIDGGEVTDSSAKKSTLKLWVDSFSHELKALELKGKNDKASTEISLDVTMNKADEVDIPSNASSLKDFLAGFTSGLSSL